MNIVQMNAYVVLCQLVVSGVGFHLAKEFLCPKWPKNYVMQFLEKTATLTPGSHCTWSLVAKILYLSF